VPSLRHTLAPLTVGARVVVRYSLAGDGSTPWTDALGVLIDQDDDTLVVTTRTGDVRIPRAAVVAAKPVPPAPIRR